MDKQEAIKILKEFHDKSALFSVRTALETVFPELKEDEDELEWLKQFIQEEAHSLSMDIRDNEDRYKLKKLQRSLEWLEKQGEQKSILNVPPREVILSIWDLGNEWKELTNGSISTEYGTQLDYIQKHWTESEYYLREKQDEQKINQPVGEKRDFGYFEEKSSDYAGPKFHEGDWVVDSLVGRVKQVQSVDKYGYNFNNGDFTSFDSANENNYHLWTIKDARDGDVLVDGGFVLIYQELSTDGYCHSYCYCNEMTFIGQGGSHGTEHSHPATQRQRELLFQKMDEAHYKWDAEKKELKKIGDISNACEAVESENEMAKAALFFIENCKDYFACNGVAKIDVINWFKETFYGK